MRRGDFEGALAHFQRLSTRHPDDPRFRIRQGDCLNQLDRYTEALDCYGKVTAASDDIMSECHFGCGVSLYNLARYEEALIAYQAALRLDPSSDDAAVNLAGVHLELGQHEEALAICRQVVARWPESWDGHAVLGNVLYAIDEYEDALAAYLKATSLCDREAGLWNNTANTYCALERYEEAASAYEQAAQINPKRIDYWLQLGGVYARNLERFPDAQDALRAGMREDPSNEDIRLEIGHTHMLAEEYEEGLAAYEHAMELNLESWKSHIGTGVCLGELGRHDAAVQALKKAAALAPTESRPHFELGLVYCSMKRRGAAVREHEILTKLNSGDSTELAAHLAEHIGESFPGDGISVPQGD